MCPGVGGVFDADGIVNRPDSREHIRICVYGKSVRIAEDFLLVREKRFTADGVCGRENLAAAKSMRFDLPEVGRHAGHRIR